MSKLFRINAKSFNVLAMVTKLVEKKILKDLYLSYNIHDEEIGVKVDHRSPIIKPDEINDDED